MSSDKDINLLLERISAGDSDAEKELFATVYKELRTLAGWFLRRERPGHTLQPTALVNEAYLKLVGQLGRRCADHSHFFRIAAQVMRQILVDYARQRNAGKRAGINVPIIDDVLSLSDERLDLVLAVDTALNRLAQQDARQAHIVELRFFGGLTEEEISIVVGTSTRTVKRDWTAAKAWLSAEI